MWLFFQPPKLQKKIQKLTKHVQKYNLLYLKLSQSRTNMDSEEWTRKNDQNPDTKKSGA